MNSQSLFQSIRIESSQDDGNQLYLNDQLAISESDIAYCEALAAPFAHAEEVGDIFILGGGHAGVLKQLITVLERRNDFRKATLVEIDIDVIRVAKKHLTALNQGIFEHPKVNLVVGDALYVIENVRRLNGVIVDLTLHNLRDTDDQDSTIDKFFRAVRKSLKPGSVVCFKAGPSGTDAGTSQVEKLHQIARNYFEQLNVQQVMIPSQQRKISIITGRKPRSSESR